MKIIDFHVSRAPDLFRLPWNFVEFQETLLYKRVSTFFVIMSSSGFSFFKKKKKFNPKKTHFYEKYIKINCFKNADTFLLLLLFIMCQRETNIEKHSWWVQELKNDEKQRVMGILYQNIYQIQKLNFQ